MRKSGQKQRGRLGCAKAEERRFRGRAREGKPTLSRIQDTKTTRKLGEVIDFDVTRTYLEESSVSQRLVANAVGVAGDQRSQ